jgi:hypothetical protein
VGTALLAFVATSTAVWLNSDFEVRKTPKAQIVSGRAALKPALSGDHQRWWQDRVTLTLDASLSRISPGARDAVARAFGSWFECGAAVPELVFDSATHVPISLDPDGVNGVVLAPIEIAGHQNDLAITVAYSDEYTGEIIEADVVFNSRYAFGVLDAAAGAEPDGVASSAVSHCGGTLREDCAGLFDLESVAAHEAGHFFGLGEDHADGAATMFECTGRCELHKRDLAGGDVSSIIELYADSPEGERSAGVGCDVGPSRGSRGHGWFVLTFGAALAWLRPRSQTRG